ncbi:MAG: hypothetical protein RJA99_3925 [Pseudomonadota bacterium]|jgi:hypothetical protein
MDTTGGALSLLRQSFESTASVVNGAVSRMQATSAVTMAANDAHTNFKIILSARIDGVKTVAELARSAIQKSGNG